MSSQALTINGFAEVTLATDAPHELAEFYVDIFGMERLGDSRDQIWLAAGSSARLGIWTPGAKEHADRGGHHVHFAVSVAPETLEEIARRASAAGVPTEGPVTHDGGDRSLYISDPAGNRAEVWDYFVRRPDEPPPGA